ncbi:septation protein A [Celerinatantimonas yamalensis]|uniref:Inner membrane-spanning protein YciB n=1 Tax=Celerinatantimonas yamalensis TaxID=559956 RepID=A0ABW9G240_9GAMM
MKQLLEFIPLIIFFIVYKMYDIYMASGALIIATGLMLVVYYLRYRRVEKTHLITFLAVAVFGGLTIALHNDVFIKWKVTVIYALFTIILLVTQYGFKAPALKRMLGKEMELPEHIWNRLNLAWAIFFAICAIANLYVAFSLSQQIWVDFKVFGLFGATLAFTVVSVIYIYRYLPKEPTKEDKD